MLNADVLVRKVAQELERLLQRRPEVASWALCVCVCRQVSEKIELTEK